MTDSYEVLFRADGGQDIGYGHLVRSGTLARQFLSDGYEVACATQTPGPATHVYPDQAAIISVDEDRHRDGVTDVLAQRRPAIAVTDSYEVDTASQRSIADFVETLVVIADDARFPFCADVVVNGNVYATDLTYDWVGSEPVWCLGEEYLLLGEAFRDRPEPPWRKDPKRVLVTMGGSDVQNTTPSAIRAIDGLDVDVDVVVGPGFQNGPEIQTAIEATGTTIQRHDDPADLATLMEAADLAVSATGSTVYELLATWTPTIGIPQTPNQELIARALADRNAIVALSADQLRKLPETVEDLLDDPDHRKAIRDRGRSLVDGRGPERTKRAIERTL